MIKIDFKWNEVVEHDAFFIYCKVMLKKVIFYPTKPDIIIIFDTRYQCTCVFEKILQNTNRKITETTVFSFAKTNH